MFGGKWSRCFNVVHTVTPTNNILNFIGQHRERFYDCRYILWEMQKSVFFLSGLPSNRLYCTCSPIRQHRHSQNISKSLFSHSPHGISYSLTYFFVTPSSSLVDVIVSFSSSSFFSSVFSFSLFNSNERNTPVPLTSSVFPIPYAIVSIAVFIDQ